MSDAVNPYSAVPPLAVSETAVVSPPTTADFMFEVDDLVALNSNSPYVRKQLRRGRIGIAFIAAVLFFWMYGVGIEVLLPLIVGLLVLGILLSPPLVRRRTRKQYAKIYQHRLPRPHTVVLSSESIFLSTPDGEYRHYWRGVGRIQATPTHVLFYLTDIQAVIVPARAFRSEAHFHAFVELGRQLWEAAGKH